MIALISRLLAAQWQTLRLYRLSVKCDTRGWGALASLLLLIAKRIANIEIVHGASIGEGTVFVHGQGTVIGPGSVVGKNCRIFHNVTLGSRDGATYPTLGDGVTCYPGAVILGGINVGNNAVIGANAVVLHDVPAGVTVAGAPARPV